MRGREMRKRIRGDEEKEGEERDGERLGGVKGREDEQEMKRGTAD